MINIGCNYFILLVFVNNIESRRFVEWVQANLRIHICCILKHHNWTLRFLAFRIQWLVLQVESTRLHTLYQLLRKSPAVLRPYLSFQIDLKLVFPETIRHDHHNNLFIILFASLYLRVIHFYAFSHHLLP